MGDWALVAEHDCRLASFVEVNLRLDGLEVRRAVDAEEALDMAMAAPPRVLIADVGLPGFGRAGLLARMREDPRTRHVAMLVIGERALPAERLLGLSAGADDYLLHPFDAVELRARVQSAVGRVEELRETSPLTGLPGNQRILAEIADRLEGREPLAAAHVDVDHFKSFNDRYGFVRGDGVILLAAEVLTEAVGRHAPGRGFVGHVGGDDFVVVCHADDVDPICSDVTRDFDARVPGLYDPCDAAAGGLVLPDRRGQVQHFPLMAVSLGVATTRHRRYRDPRGMLAVANEMKSYVKAGGHGSAYAVDARGAGSEAVDARERASRLDDEVAAAG